MEEEDMLSAKEAVEFLGVSRATFWILVKRYQIPKYQRPIQAKKIFFKRTDLEPLKQMRPVQGQGRFST